MLQCNYWDTDLWADFNNIVPLIPLVGLRYNTADMFIDELINQSVNQSVSDICGGGMEKGNFLVLDLKKENNVKLNF